MQASSILNVTAAKLAAQRVPGVRAVALQQARGRKYMVVSAEFHGRRECREIPVHLAGTVDAAQVRHALNVLVGRTAAEAFKP